VTTTPVNTSVLLAKKLRNFACQKKLRNCVKYMTIHIHLINTKLLGTKQEAQLLQRSHNASCR